MILLIVYVLLALVVSFLCSVFEAVILSVTSAYIVGLEQEGKPSGVLLHGFKTDINKPLAAILTLNTIAHTIGAAGAGAQAAVVFGDAYVGVAAAVLTLLILIFSEIIPKTLGAQYWRALAPVTAHVLRYLVWILYPFVKLSEFLTRRFASGPALGGFSRSEFAVMADLSAREGKLEQQESEIVKNLMLLRETRVKDAMTPRSVLFSLSESTTVGLFFHKYDHVRFSRIPVFRDNEDGVTGFVLRSDLLLAQARGNTENTLRYYVREMDAVPEIMTLSSAFDAFLKLRAQILLVVNEYGGVEGVITLEDLIETVLGLEIVDEGDKAEDMQELARRKWRKRAREMGLDVDE